MSFSVKQLAALESWLAEVSSAANVKISNIKPLTGGAIQENWKFECKIDDGPNHGSHRFVLRSDAPSAVATSLSRSQEFEVLKLAHAVGVTVPEPLWLCDDLKVTGRAFYIMRLVEGVALGPKVVKDQSLGGDRELLGKRLGKELAKIHSVHPPRSDLSFLKIPDNHPAVEAIDTLRSYLDDIGEARPVLEWGLRWAELNLTNTSEMTRVHKDFRSGNYLVDSHGLNGILDWEFAGWGDPMSDLGWFCAECWRFSRPDLEAGGISSRDIFYQGYRECADIKIDEDAVLFWELMAHIRWAVIALQQCNRHISGNQKSLELALIGRLLPELELQILNMTSPQTWSAA